MQKSSTKRRPMNVGRIIALVFLAIISVGTILLMLPVSSRDGNSAEFVTALFTATSSTCVTGLILKDTFTQWSSFGQIIIITLIEIGGLGFMSIASSMIFLFKKKISMNERLAIAFSVGSDDMNDAIRIQKKMLVFSIGTEVIGALILAARLSFDHGIKKALSLGFFHSISAFCNAGFDIFGFDTPNSSVALYGTDPVVILTLSFLIVFGGIGFIVWDEIFSKKKPKKWSVYTKLVFITTASLLVLGTILILVSEWSNGDTLGNLPFSEKLLSSFFQSVTSRTAGFAGFDQGKLTDAGKAVTMFLMLIGGSSGSTAGGLKTVTFITIFLFLVARLRGKDDVNVFGRTISFQSVLNALSLFGIMVTLAFFGGTFISLSSGLNFTDGLYESISALATVGLTCGITPLLSTGSKFLMILFMYFGRVGILTISLGFFKIKRTDSKIKYAMTDLLIG